MTRTTDTTTTTTTTMTAVVQDRYGSSEVLRLAEVARPDIRTARSWCACTPPASTAARST